MSVKLYSTCRASVFGHPCAGVLWIKVVCKFFLAEFFKRIQDNTLAKFTRGSIVSEIYKTNSQTSGNNEKYVNKGCPKGLIVCIMWNIIYAFLQLFLQLLGSVG